MSPFPSHSISPPPNPPSICHSLLPLFHHPFLFLTSIRNVRKCQFFFLRLLTSGLVPGGLPQSWTMVMQKTGVKGILIGWFKMTCIVSASKTTLYTIIMYLWGKRTIFTHQHTIKCDKLPIILPFFFNITWWAFTGALGETYDVDLRPSLLISVFISFFTVFLLISQQQFIWLKRT